MMSEEERYKAYKQALNIQFVQKMMIKDEKLRDSHRPNLDIDDVYSEQHMFPGGLPAVMDVENKKRFTEEEKLMIEFQKNPPSSPRPKEMQGRGPRGHLPKLFNEPKVAFPVGESSNEVVYFTVAFFRKYKQYEFIQRPMTEDDK